MASFNDFYDEKNVRISITSLLFSTILYLYLLFALSINAEPTIVVIIFSAITFFIIAKRFGFFSFYFLLYVTFLLFYVSRYVVDYIGYFDLRQIRFFYDLTLDDEMLYKQAVILISFSMAYIYSTWLIPEKRYTKLPPIDGGFINKSFFKFSSLILGCIYLVKVLLIVKVTSFDYLYFQSNYVYVMSQVPFVVRFSSNIFLPCFFCLLLMLNNKREFILFSAAFLFVSASALLLGGRAEFITSFLVVVWLYGKKFNQFDMKIKNILPVVFISFIFIYFLQFISSFRFGGEVTEDNAFLNFLRDQGISLIVIPFSEMFSGVLTGQDIYNHFLRFFVAPFSGALRFFGESVSFNSMFEVIMKYINPSALKAGYGLGGSLPAELYVLFGMLGTFIVMPILFLIYSFLFNSRPTYFSPIGFFVGAITLVGMKSIFFLMRGYSLDFISEMIRNTIYILPLIFVYYIFVMLSFVVNYNRGYYSDIVRSNHN